MLPVPKMSCTLLELNMVHNWFSSKQLEEENIVLFMQCKMAIIPAQVLVSIKQAFLVHENLGPLVLFVFYVKKPPPFMID